MARDRHDRDQADWKWPARAVVVLMVVFVIGTLIQLVTQELQHNSVAANLASIIVEVNTLGPERFKEKLMEVCRPLEVRLDPSDISIVNDNRAGLITVTLRYKRLLAVPFFEFTRERTVSRKTAAWPPGTW